MDGELLRVLNLSIPFSHHTGSSVSIPICGGRLALGTWQGIYLNEHRDAGTARTLVVTLQGEEDPRA